MSPTSPTSQTQTQATWKSRTEYRIGCLVSGRFVEGVPWPVSIDDSARHGFMGHQKCPQTVSRIFGIQDGLVTVTALYEPLATVRTLRVKSSLYLLQKMCQKKHDIPFAIIVFESVPLKPAWGFHFFTSGQKYLLLN
jgi:hypothetical protein